MTPICATFVKTAVALSQYVSLSTESSYIPPLNLTPAQQMMAVAKQIEAKDKAILQYRSDLESCQKSKDFVVDK